MGRSRGGFSDVMYLLNHLNNSNRRSLEMLLSIWNLLNYENDILPI